MPNILIPVADGSEDLETVTLIDLFRRANFLTSVASIYEDRKEVRCSRGTRIIADSLLSAETVQNERWDAIILPGGMPGAEHLRDSKLLIEMLRKQNKLHRVIGAICAAPAVILEHHSLIGGRNATCFPDIQDELMTYSSDKVVVDRELITSQGPATAMAFGLEIIKKLGGEALSQQIAKGLLYHA